MVIRNIWKEGKGAGKESFKFRTVAYYTGILLVIIHHVQNNLEISFPEYAFILVFLVMPTVFLYRYIQNGSTITQVIRDSRYDFFFAGLFIGFMNLCIIPSFVFALGTLTNYFAIRGFHKLYRILFLPLGCLPIFLLEGFYFHFDSSNLMLLLSLSYCVAHFTMNSYILYYSAYKVKLQNIEIEKQRQEILEQSEELRVLNESLQSLNAGLEINVLNRAKELEIKNRKLEEYLFINAHKLRAPVASILGLIQLLDYSE
jgi:signal transduction histidine kinase